MAVELSVRGLELREGDVIIMKSGKPGAVLMEKRGVSQWGEPIFWTDTKVIAPFRCNQVYRIVRATEEEMMEACEGHG
jgi:hypothetical protein